MNFQIPAEIIDILRTARNVTVLTGAGVSAESGVPTFRDAQTGLWAHYRPEDLATPQAFKNNPRLVWEWYAWRRALVAKAMPNSGHIALNRLEALFTDFWLITQNVDSLHQRAGNRRIIELHGNINRAKCSYDNRIYEVWEENAQIPPCCTVCGGLLRPDVVWFGESLPAEKLSMAVEAAQHSQVFLSVGTAAVVEPAASLPFIAREAGAVIVEINTSATPLTAYAHFTIFGSSGNILPALVSALES